MTIPDLLDQNRIENENTKHELVSEMYLQLLSHSPQIEAFVTWLLALTGGTAALLIVNVESITKIVSNYGIRGTIYLITASAVFGLISKLIFVLSRKNYREDLSSNRDVYFRIISEHMERRNKIEENAKLRGIGICNIPDIEIRDATQEYARSLPFWGEWLVLSWSKKRGSVLRYSARVFKWQCHLCCMQSIAYMCSPVFFVFHIK
ncbi:hypothetical protein [Verminephrobacter aporrectodeae]|uniref:hypothetical protein n=1 Tax=Verminephrobacter aporrectodeae TaxID=1110389 RepID=UPI002243AA43|nr:hypothetical protein [Verminephrobacter aporrectodeae]